MTYKAQDQRMLQLPPAARCSCRFGTPLAVTRPVDVRRDIFQMFHWIPDTATKPSSWTLRWWLAEVVGNLWMGLAGEENLLVAKGSTPPASPDLAGLVQLRVNANGEAEFTILGRTVEAREDD